MSQTSFTKVKGSVKAKGSVRLGSQNPGVTLQTLAITPINPTVPVGDTVSFTATGTYSDGSVVDLSAQAAWTTSAPLVATNSGNLYTCAGAGSTTVTATVSVVSATTALACQQLQISPPSGVLTAIKNVVFTQQFSTSGGTSPYTYSSSDLPGWLTLSPVGDGIHANLTGTSSVTGLYNFHITVVDNIGRTTGAVPYTVQVVNVSGEDNTGCNSDGTTNYSPNNDGPAFLPQNCVYTAIAATPFGGTGTLYVCPSNQTSGGVAVAGCLNAQTPGFMNYFNTVQAAVNAAACGNWIKIYATVNDLPSGTQNIFDESVVLPATTCWGNVNGWIGMSTTASASLPPPGTRITPAWAGQASVPGRPAYLQPSSPGIYVPMIRCLYANTTCATLSTPQTSAGISAWRIFGIEFTAPYGRNSTCPLNLNGTHQCSPGADSEIVSIGCANFQAGNCGFTGATHIILDRIIVHGCSDKSTIGCKDSYREGVELQGGQYLALIDSYVYDFKTLLNGIGPSVEAHGLGGGNTKNSADDGPTKVQNNFIEGSSVDAFWGGAGSTTGVYSNDYTFRKNRLFKPLLWKVNDPSFTLMGGSVFDAWVAKPGSGYSGGAACTIDAPTGPNPVQATCHTIVSGGQVLDVIIDNIGSGYITNPHITIAGGDGKARVFPLDGIYNVKNCAEWKNGRRVLVEGNICTNVWKGQSDQDGYQFLLTPKNANHICQTCTAQDFTIRYNFLQNSNRGLQLGTEAATQCDPGQTCLPDILARISIHDDVIVGLNQEYWVSQPGAKDGFGGGAFHYQNANPQSKSIQGVTVNHVTAIVSSPTGASPTALENGLSFGYTCKNTTAVFQDITVENSILGGGVMATGSSAQGCYQCQTAGCSGGSVTALKSMAISDYLGTPSGGLYVKGQVMAGVVDGPGTCTVQPTSCSFTGGSPAVAATCKMKFDNTGALTAVYPDTVGQAYASAPAVAFSGQTCSVQPTAHTLLGGVNTPSTDSWCYDHNLHATAVVAGEVPMTPYPTAQGDATNNVCASHGGGGNLSISNWSGAKFVNFLTDPLGAENPIGDLHLQVTSPGHNAGNDGTDLGANIDLVLGKSDGSAASPYTGITINNGVIVLPQ